MGVDAEPAGVWATYDYDFGPYLIAVSPTEVEAYRLTKGYGRVVFLPWGLSLQDAIKAEEEVEAQ